MIPSRIIDGRKVFAWAFALLCVALLSMRSHAGETSEREKIEAAIPSKAPAKPHKPRKLLIFDLNVDYGGHPSAKIANQAFTLMGKKTGAFETTISKDPTVFKPESLRTFDAVFLNNTVGNLFTDPALRQSLLEFVYAGGGLMGVHGTSVAFTHWKQGAKEDWPEFAIMLGTRGAAHRESDEQVFIKLDDPGHPVNSCFNGKGFEYRDEFFRPQGTYSRNRNRVLIGIDTDKTDLSGHPRKSTYRKDNDYAMAWVRAYGRGRIFYTTFGHNKYVFWDPKMLEFYLAGAQFVLGDLPAPTIPSGKLTPAIRAQEKLGWRFGIEAYTFHKYTFFETIEKTAQLGLAYINGLSFQKVSKDIPKKFAPGLTDAELKQIRLKLDATGVRLLTYYIQNIPADPKRCRAIFEFGRKIGIETFLSEPKLEALPEIEKFCNEYGINVAIHNHGKKGSPEYWNPEGVLNACKGRGKRIGACPDIGYWLRAGVDPIKGLNVLKDRVLAIQMHDLHEVSAKGHDVAWGTGAGRMEEVVHEIHRLKLKPTMIGLEFSHNWFKSMPDIVKSIEFFNEMSLQLVK